MISSSSSETASMSFDRHSAAMSANASGISLTSKFCPFDSASKYNAFIWMTSMIPSNAPGCPGEPAPIGIVMATGVASSRFSICSSVRSKLAPMRSILLMKQTRGTPYSLACRQTVSLCASTPSTALKITIAPSSTRNDRCTSAVKSTCRACR